MRLLGKEGEAGRAGRGPHQEQAWPAVGAVRGAERSSAASSSPGWQRAGGGLERGRGRAAHLSRALSLLLPSDPSGRRGGKAAKGQHCC